MKYIFLVLILFLNNIYANEELNKYLNDKKLKYSIIQDTINQRIIIDLLYDENKMIIFSKYKNKDYQKIFDKKLYFCNDTSYYIYTARGVVLENNILTFFCSSTMGGGAFYINYNFNKENILQKIIKDYADDDGILLKRYIFIPNANIPSLRNFENENFADEYLNKNDKNFIEVKIVIPNTLKELLYYVQHSQVNTVVSKDFNITFENEPLNTKTVQIYNDIAYYLQQANANEEAIFLLEKIIEKYPNRIVAYLNLADSYIGINNKEEAKENYEKYVKLMKQDNKDERIPKRVLEFLENE